LLETLSISVTPKPGTGGPRFDVALTDDLWAQVLSKGKICGDERWLVGENGNKEVVIFRFDEEPPKRR